MESKSQPSIVSSFEGGKRKPVGAVLFTGPDGVGDHRVKVEEQRYIGHTCLSTETTGDVNYICRGAKGSPHPLPKTASVGEIGWGVPGTYDHSLLKSGHQIQLGEFRQSIEDHYTHRCQTPHAKKSQEKHVRVSSGPPLTSASTVYRLRRNQH